MHKKEELKRKESESESESLEVWKYNEKDEAGMKDINKHNGRNDSLGG